MKKNGFTLVELLSIIVILGIISTIVYTVVTKNIETTRINSFKTSVQNLLEASKEYVVTNYEENDFPEGGIDVVNSDIEIKNNNFIAGIIKRDGNDIIIVQNVTDGNYCANGTKNDLDVTKGSCEASDDTKPEIDLKVLKSGLNEITIMIKMQDAQSGIKEYNYCYGINEADNCYKIDMNNERTLIKEVIKLTKLKQNTTYKIEVEALNNSDSNNISNTQKEVKTLEIEAPQFSVSSSLYSSSKVVRIIYPEVKGYIYKYKIGGEEVETLENNKYEIEKEVTDNTIIVASIYKDDELVINDSIEITGIDNIPPTNIVEIPQENEWTLSKKVIVTATDLGTGLALRPYSYDGGLNWVKENEITVTENQTIKVRTRDRLGNMNKKFTLNGIEYDEYTFKNIDNVGPKITLEVTDGKKAEVTNEWYISNNVVVTLTINDQVKELIDNNETIKIGGIGLDESTMEIKINNKAVPFTKISSDKYLINITDNGTNKITVAAKDLLGNKANSELVVKKDSLIPQISPKSNPINYSSGDFNNLISSYFNVTVGVSGQRNIECSANLLPVRKISELGYNTRKNVVCKVTNNAGVSAGSGTNNTIFRYYYGATSNYKTCSGVNRWWCEKRKDTWCHSGGYGDDVTYGSGGCGGNYYYYWDWCEEWYSYTCFSHYSCPSGGTISGTACYF